MSDENDADNMPETVENTESTPNADTTVEKLTALINTAVDRMDTIANALSVLLDTANTADSKNDDADDDADDDAKVTDAGDNVIVDEADLTKPLDELDFDLN